MPPASLGHFDAVIVGSGFGGSVMAYRLAKEGRKVLLLERGKPYPPGSFARTPQEMQTNFWDPSERLWGLYDFWSFKGIEGLVSSGLGGGSLIYANVLLRKDRDWFDIDLPDGGKRPWPVSYDDLVDDYEAVEDEIRPSRYPFEATTPKTGAARRAAEQLPGVDFQLPPIAVAFKSRPDAAPSVGEEIHEEHPNIHGAKRYTCRLVGECDVGCNSGSKDSLDFTYLSAAEREGARIETLHEVKAFRPRPEGGYAIDVVHHRPDGDGPLREELTVTADRLVLSAGTFGSTYLLLRNRKALRATPKLLGTGFSGNGDLLMFALRCVDRDGKDARLIPTYGPVITTATRFPDGGTRETRGFYLQEAGYPLVGAWMAELASTPARASRAAKFGLRLLWEKITRNPQSNLSGELSEIFGDPSMSYSSIPLLAMGRDFATGKMSLSRRNQLELDWTTKKSNEYFARVRRDVTRFAEAMGARDVDDSPLWYFKRVITVHPLGGCPMGHGAEDGVVSAVDGTVFGNPGLHVADGAVLPSSVGANPSLTIAAVSNRFASAILDS